VDLTKQSSIISAKPMEVSLCHPIIREWPITTNLASDIGGSSLQNKTKKKGGGGL